MVVFEQNYSKFSTQILYFIDYVNAHTIQTFDGIDMDEDLDDMRMSLTGKRSPGAKLLRKMCNLMRLLGRE